MNRDPCAQTGAQWANIHSIVLTNPKAQYHIGDDLKFTFRYQDRDSGASVEWYLDTDTNPYNVPAATLGTAQPLSTTGDNVAPGTATCSTSGTLAGSYRCYAKITSANGGQPRYEYATNVVSLTAAPVGSEPPALATVSPDSLPGLPLPQTQFLTITGSGFIAESRLEFFDGVTTYSNRTPIYDSPTQLRYDIKVGNVSANWTVKVLNGSLESNPGAFTVTATPDSTAPPAPLNVTGAFAGGVHDDFYYVDWTNPSDASGLAKVWWKLGSPPTSPGDGVGLELPLFKPLPVSTLTTNPQTLYLWLEDGAGNKDHNQRASILLFRDTGAPFIVTPPQDRAVIEGASAVFSVVAGGATPLAYQWQRNGLNLPGANASSYVTPPVTPADSGAQFRVIVTNALGAVTSAWATLTVNTASVLTWIGDWYRDWNDPLNWNPPRVPTASDTVNLNYVHLSIPSNAAFAVINFNGGGLSGNLTVSGTLNWTAGTLQIAQITIPPGGVLNILGDAEKAFSGGQMNNAGTVVWAGGGISCYGVSAFNNAVGGIFDVRADRYFGFIAGSEAAFTNGGTFRKSAGSGSAYIGMPFLNTGVVEVESGTIGFWGLSNDGAVRALAGSVELLCGGGECEINGTFEISASAAVRLVGNTFRLNPDARFSGAGPCKVSGRLSLEGTVNMPNLELVTGGTISGVFTNAGTLNWTEGNLDGCTLTVAQSGVLNLKGPGVKVFWGARINNAGTVVWRDNGSAWAYKNEGQSVISNLVGGVFEVQGDGTLTPVMDGAGGLDFYNAGVFRKVSGTNQTALLVPFYSTGTVEVQSGMLSFSGGYTQTAGSTILDGGSLSAGSPIYIDGGRLSGNGVVSAAVVNAAEVGPGGSPGTLTIVGSYTQTSAGTLNLELGGLAPGSQHDRLAVKGPATLDGALLVSLIDGFQPFGGDSFEVMTWFTRSGSFATANGLSPGNGIVLATNYTSTALSLVTLSGTTNAVPPRLTARRDPSGSLRLRLAGGAGRNHILQAATNLADWVTLLTTNPPSGVVEIVDSESGQFPHRFYRAFTE